MLSAVSWTGAGDGSSWSDFSNWSGNQVPSADDDVSIDAPGSTINIASHVSIRSLQSNAHVSVESNWSLVLTAGTSTISGELSCVLATLQVLGSGTSLSVTGAISGDEASFIVRDGGMLSLAGLTSYAGGTVNNYRPQMRAEGSGSVLDVSNLTNLIGKTAYNHMDVRALSGGTIKLNGLTSISQGYLDVWSEGAASFIDLSALTEWNSKGASYLQAIGNGTILAPNLKRMIDIIATLRPNGILSTEQWESTNGGTVVADGVNVVLPNLVAGDQTSFIARNGGGLTLPALSSYAAGGYNGYTPQFKAEGAGSLLDLSSLTDLVGKTAYNYMYVRAFSGGRLVMNSVTSIDDGYLDMWCDGEESFIDASGLTHWNPWAISYMRASAGGAIQLADVLDIEAVQVTIDPEGTLLLSELRVQASSTLKGTGTLRAHVVNKGTLAPDHNTVGLTIDGDLTLTDTSDLRFTFSGNSPGDEYDQLHVTGALTMGGKFSIEWKNNFEPTSGESFQLIDVASFAGYFETYTNLSIGAPNSNSDTELEPELSATSLALRTTNHLGAKVTSIGPALRLEAPLDGIDVTFSEPILGGTFTLADILISGPGGIINPVEIRQQTPTQFRIELPPQSATGEYQVRISRTVFDTARNLMNQDGDGTNGEVAEDDFTGTILLRPSTGSVVFDPAFGRWWLGYQDGGDLVWNQGPRWNADLDWRIFTGDVNGDGLLDGIGVTPTNQMFAALNDGGGGLQTVSLGTFDAAKTFSHWMVGDYDGNGSDDLLAMDPQGNWISRGLSGEQRLTNFFGRYTPDGWDTFRTGDFNGDGVDDIVGLRNSADANSSIFYYGISRDLPVGRRFSGHYAGRLGQSIETGGWHNMMVADFNGDQKADLLIQHSGGQTWFATTTGAAIASISRANYLQLSAGARITGPFTGEFRTGDFNGDGLADILAQADSSAGLQANSLLVGLTHLSNSGPAVVTMSTDTWGQLPTSSSWALRSLIGDINADGRDDIISFDLGSHQTVVGISTGFAFGPWTSWGMALGGTFSDEVQGGIGKVFPEA
ncbi:MAG: VCBS repeat-containing protein [Planctomycetaceae bacterium]|nr:VCBS repeat-containing protein [Planctomycetaceae bacterium]